MRVLFIIVLVMLGFLEPLKASVDFDKGIIAYESEDYATVLQNFSRAANYGHSDAQYH